MAKVKLYILTSIFIGVNNGIDLSMRDYEGLIQFQRFLILAKKAAKLVLFKVI